ncbi:RnfABCDGE type electron transport complex subunit D [Rhodobacter sphaeroides]|jgi:electron transport complex, RnfABCDGE type, D subunit|uniref:Ion-translocating oxidoreductase complex subunit D n=1 Tax=Cereibacter sphaeroides (strain ATCC 17023 / DSM 158 / JCM 6121 / CCUG 31486 / LMG 2827 / NBRC 12203 / NCIMB 8253 / ATH 2.4.1.) TaxID=272943 RepID=Q3IXC3_CERS4|nr:RnfABCDGE type electron transport complex subunit D [Cereibacter sphaeroides]ABA80811.1 RnfD protein [Cereibacter sphaeroides 2.4.1]AMJ49137.1 electron transporter RnfD [Cereibacter sphaeroides]ANS35854.1 electron transporter RnfD [Cereibacter sphaeroides]ATN64907.1 electron transporter RnfD [Cereibacter sphaeroides]AXC63101.1 RnfABCDGE type electron transport complex subunit D [Cereibacter sphaeroides 2.4.1]
MTAPLIISGPHTHTLFTVSRTMLTVSAALAPATLFGLWMFGWPAIFLFLVTVASAWLFEVACLRVAGKPVARFAGDGSAILTGWLVAMTLPPYAPWWLGMTGSAIAIVIAKHLFGGLGQNLFNPAMVARAMLLIALPVHMTTWVAPVGLPEGPGFLDGLAITFAGSQEFDAVSSASTLSHIKSQIGAGATMSEIAPDLSDLEARLIGLVPGSLGETSTILLLLGGIALMALRIITPVIPLSVLGTLAGLSAVASTLAPDRFAPPLLHLTSGSTMLCAFFIATDYVTSPVTAMGKLVYGVAIGALVFVIRTWGSFPEGVAFAVLLMNACTPLIETYVRPRVFGRTRTGKSLPVKARTPRGGKR